MKSAINWIAVVYSCNARIFQDCEEKLNLVKEINEQQNFDDEVAKFLQESVNENKFHNLFLVCPYKIAAPLERKLSYQVEEKITYRLYQNVSELDVKELREHIVEEFNN